MQTQQTFHLPRRAVANLKPNHLRRETLKRTQFTEIRILCHHQVAVLTGIFPYFSVFGLVSIDPKDMAGIGK